MQNTNMMMTAEESNTDLPGGKAVAKSIFRHYSKGKKIKTKKEGNVLRRYTSSDKKYQIRYTRRKNRKLKVNLDIKRGGIYEDTRF
ncbi:hypothetical protein [Siminovitchia sp. 179-K 8D1 HS]|uniref:hypothetical protein n=1 Tax=Siminovitchia sp. 179-K 8D1 HS TaxID=3142385 RepID=UPI0039A31237